MSLLKDLFNYEDPNPFEDETAAVRERISEFILLTFLAAIIAPGLLCAGIMAALSLIGAIDPVGPWETYK